MNRPHRPPSMSAFAEACLTALASDGLANAISIGGALGLLHYCDYRTTHDVDAWWEPQTTEQQKKQVIAKVEQTLKRSGQTLTRQWGDVVSVELLQDAKAIFSFQIARRSAKLEASAPAPHTGVLLDSLNDLVASKMVALVERGAPRDFRDIHQVCSIGLLKPDECWQLWHKRQKLAGADTDFERAKLAVETHLARIAQHRPLGSISDAGQRAEAQTVRDWFGEVFLHAF